MKILIIRHLESQKNLTKAFSSLTDDYTLTKHGIEEGKNLASAIFRYTQKNNLQCKTIHAAKSQRALSTAQIISNAFGGLDVKEWDELRSTQSGVLRGKTEEEGKRINPVFMKQLRLFRCGLFSSYNFEKVYNKEDKWQFEKRVNSCIDEIINGFDDSLRIIVVHHSSLTAIMIKFARQFLGYPTDFYGKVDCELGNLYLVNISNEKFDVELCNATWRDLLNYEDL